MPIGGRGWNHSPSLTRSRLSGDRMRVGPVHSPPSSVHKYYSATYLSPYSSGACLTGIAPNPTRPAGRPIPSSATHDTTALPNSVRSTRRGPKPVASPRRLPASPTDQRVLLYDERAHNPPPTLAPGPRPHSPPRSGVRRSPSSPRLPRPSPKDPRVAA